MFKELDSLAPSNRIAAKTIYKAFKILKEEGGSLPGREVVDKIRAEDDLTDWEKERYEKTGYIRWESVLHFYTIDCTKAGFLRKKKGVWYLTEEGDKAISLGPLKLFEAFTSAYKQWEKKRDEERTHQESNIDYETDKIESDAEQLQKANLDQLEDLAISGIKDFINSLNPYEFQDLVAALLRSMGYHTPFISPKGRDGGLDIVAYQDPLGAKSPRIKVQVKHRPESAVAVPEIRSLLGLLNKEGDIGLFVTSGRFTTESERFARDSHIHVKLMDFDSFISLWEENYHKLNDDEKMMLPLHPVNFLGSIE